MQIQDDVRAMDTAWMRDDLTNFKVAMHKIEQGIVEALKKYNKNF